MDEGFLDEKHVLEQDSSTGLMSDTSMHLVPEPVRTAEREAFSQSNRSRTGAKGGDAGE